MLDANNNNNILASFISFQFNENCDIVSTAQNLIYTDFFC